jgi:hypothetical protein
VQAAWRHETRASFARIDLPYPLMCRLTQFRVRGNFPFHLARDKHRDVFAGTFLVLFAGRPSYGMGALLLGPTLLVGVVLALHLFTAAPGQALYYLAGTRSRLGQTGCLR